MTAEQHPLFTDPHWVDAWNVGDKVRSTLTNNHGEVVRIVPGRHVYIHWAKWLNEPDGYVGRHSSALGLERVEP